MKPESQEAFVALKAAMLLHVPFFASLMLDQMKIKVGKFPEVFGSNTATAATNGSTIWIDEDFLAKCKLPEAVFLMCHEIGHAMWNHMPRAKYFQTTGFDGKEFNPKKWNYAGDYVINDMLIKAKIGDMPKGGLHDAKYDHLTDTADDVYRKLPDDPDQNSNGGKPLDKHIAADETVSQAEWKRAIQSAADRAKATGQMPESLSRLVDALVNPKVPWQELLRTMLMRAISRDALTWTKPHRRRLIMQNVVLPSYTGFGAGEVVVAVDTSGSIGEKELKVFLSEVQGILDDARPERVWLIACDAKIHDVTELAVDDNLAENPPPLGGGGGTSFVPPFEWVKEQGLSPSALIYLTDMMGTFPSEAPAYKTIWCSTSEGREGPFGQTVEIDLGGYDE